MIAYLDSSAIIKQYLHDEPGFADFYGDRGRDRGIVTSRLSFVEVRAGLAAARRATAWTERSTTVAVTSFGRPGRPTRSWTCPRRCAASRAIAGVFGLRAGDAIQLASMLEPARKMTLIVVAWDARLRAAAASAGLAVFPRTAECLRATRSSGRRRACGRTSSGGRHGRPCERPGAGATGPAGGGPPDHRRRGAWQEPPDPVRRRAGDPNPSAHERVVASLPAGRALAPTAGASPPRHRGARGGRGLLRCPGGGALRAAGRVAPPGPGQSRPGPPVSDVRCGRGDRAAAPDRLARRSRSPRPSSISARWPASATCTRARSCGSSGVALRPRDRSR